MPGTAAADGVGSPWPPPDCVWVCMLEGTRQGALAPDGTHGWAGCVKLMGTLTIMRPAACPPVWHWGLSGFLVS